jgi:general secretion pathway protein L
MWANSRNSAIIVAHDDGSLCIHRLQGEVEEKPERVGNYKNEPRTVAVRMAQMFDQAGTPRDIDLCIPSAAVLRSCVAMPKTSRRNLAAALRYELSRLSPVDPRELYFDYNVSAHVSPAKSQSVELRIARRGEVDELVELCHVARLSIASIGFGGDPRSADIQLFPVDKLAFARAAWRQWKGVLLVCLLLLLGIGLLLAAYVRHAEFGETLANEVTIERQSAAAVERLQQRTLEALKDCQFLALQKQTPPFVSVLADLSRVLPDNTWITDLTLNGKKLQISGYSASAADLINAFGKSGRFASAQFTGPLTRDARSTTERFDISMEVRQLPR